MSTKNVIFSFVLFVFLTGNVWGKSQTSYFLGEVKMSSPAGVSYGSSVSLVKRVASQANNKITEYVLSLDADKEVQEYVAIFEVKGSMFSVRDNHGTFSGEGKLFGKPWKWNSWKYTVLMNDGSGSLKGEDFLSDDGLVIKKTLFSPDGTARVMFDEELKSISQSMYDVLRAKLTL